MKARTRNSKFGEAWLLAAALTGPVILAGCSASHSRSASEMGAGAGTTANGGTGHPDGGGSVSAGGLSAGHAGQTGLGGGAGTGGVAGDTAGGSAGLDGSGAAGNAGRAGVGGANGGAAGSGVAGGAAGAAGSSGTGGASAVLAATPPMGWNSWNTFQCNLDESLIKGVADALVSSGMAAVGFQYVNLDDCWMDGRDANGNLRWNASKFPAGIPALADYVHSKGLKLGIYETPNTSSCVGIYGGISTAVAVGSLGHEAQDAKTFASWGVDYLKYDLCQGQRSSFAQMRDALAATGRPIVYSINPGNGTNDLCPPNTCTVNLPSTANLWRIGFDINASWSSVTSLIDQDAALDSYASPGHWNDPDMLEVGNGLSSTEDRSHFSMWAMLAAPLLAGNDIRSMSAATRTVLTNAEVTAVDQDPRGAQGRLVATPGANLQVWSKVLSGSNARAVALLNRGASSASITVPWTALGLPAGNATVRDLWAHTDLGAFNGSYTASAIPSHGVTMLKVTSAP